MPSKKFFVRQIIRKTGWDLVRFQAAFEDVQTKLLADEHIDCLVDVGANEGQYSQRMRQLGYDGLIVAFEPLASAHSTLLDNLGRDPNFVAINGAAGAHDGESMMFRSENSVSSSLLPILDRHVAAAPQSRYVSSEPVTISRLDSCDIPGDRLWLKLDVQGGELAVIDGAAQTLRRTRVVQVELSLTPLYDGAPLIEETVARLRAEGYIPVALEGGFSDGATGECLQVEGLFRRSGS